MRAGLAYALTTNAAKPRLSHRRIKFEALLLVFLLALLDYFGLDGCHDGGSDDFFFRGLAVDGADHLVGITVKMMLGTRVSCSKRMLSPTARLEMSTSMWAGDDARQAFRSRSRGGRSRALHPWP